ncbi:MAG TPA: alpha/beta fold hydrolase [Dyella sp.]|uniref:alpha/beta hydrolase n=1 Tax=Dyella sp. TaxID=1869338 RepID=UPI002F9283E5
MVTFAVVGALAAAVATHVRTDTIDLQLPAAPGQHVALHCVAPEHPSGEVVLFVHGATFPTRLAFGFEFRPGDSWMHFMAAKGFLACGLDFLGYGGSSRPSAMLGAADAAPPFERAGPAADEIALAVDYLRGQRGARAIHLVAHSWGTIPAARYAALHGGQLRSLTLFGPIVPVPSAKAEPPVRDAWFGLTAQQRLEQLRFKNVLPSGKVLLEPAVEQHWAGKFAVSAPHVQGDEPDDLRIPNGPNADIAAAMAGQYPYAPDDIKVPVFVVYGNYDVVVDDEGATKFLARFTASPLKWQLRIDDGTHVMHLERQRHSLYESVAAFIRAAEAVSP